MSRRTLTASLIALALAALAIPAAASARTGAIVFSMVSEDHRTHGPGGEPLPPSAPEGGIHATRGHRLNQLTDNPADAEPSFSRDGRTIAFARNGDVYAMRADGSGLRRLTAGAQVDERPLIAPNGRYVLFERRNHAGGQRDLYTVRTGGGPSHRLVGGPREEHEASFAPNGRSIAFVRTRLRGAREVSDVFRIRPSGAQLRRLTRTARIDEWRPLNLGGRVVFSRGRRAVDASGYADVYSVRWDGRGLRRMIAGAGSAYVDDAHIAGKRRLLLFHRDQGLWVKRLGGRSRLLERIEADAELTAVFFSDGRDVALYRSWGDVQSIAILDVAGGHLGAPQVVAYPEAEHVSSEIGPAIAWQPVR